MRCVSKNSLRRSFKWCRTLRISLQLRCKNVGGKTKDVKER